MFDLASIGLPPEGVLVDIGASTGEFFREAATVMRPTRSLCVEMQAGSAEWLQGEAQYHDPPAGRFVAHRACGDAPIIARTRRTMFQPASSLLLCDPEVGYRLGHDMKQLPDVYQELVYVETLDSLCSEYHIEHIDLLKIDVQGYESRVLRGAKRILPHTDRVIIEILLAPHYEGQSDPDEIRQLLSEAGLRATMQLACDRFPDTGEILQIDELWERA